ncbi:hypothetical protein V5O48_000370 [Marasmius crinis-equi]|uniref:MFS general substrate transporter n=1 Tax=Marasmius crinis-equi TaxID=585013 RepID=A0ABR3G1I4_9AGAR
MTGGGFTVLDSGSVAGRFSGQSHIRGPPWLNLPTLAICFLGVQISWSVEMSNASPYLLSLGLSKSAMAVVFVAGPLSGLIVQPLIGVLADNNTSRWGRRRPYMMLGTVICIFALLVLGWTKVVAGWFVKDSSSLVITLAVLSIYVIDFSINAVQAMDRALLVDVLPSALQPAGNAWAAKMLAIGSVVGFFIAWLGWFPILFYTSVYVGDLNKRAFYATTTVIPPPGSPATEITPETLSSLDTESSRLGSRALFYSSLITLFVNFALPYFVTEASTNSRKRKQRRHQQTVENGFGSSHNLNGTHGGGMSGHMSGQSPNLLEGILRRMTNFAIPERLQMHLSSLWTISHAVFALCMLGTFFTSSVTGASTLVAITGFSWAITQWVPFALLGEAILTEPSALTDDGASIQLTDTRHRRSGSISLARASSESRRELSMLGSRENGRAAAFAIQDESDLDSDEENDEERKKDNVQKRSTLLGNPEAGVSKVDIPNGGRSEGQYPQDDDDEGEDAVLVGRARAGDEEGDAGIVEDLGGHGNSGTLSAKAGIILGIHNIFVVVPQFLVTGISSIIFAIFDPSKSVLHAKHPGTSNRTGNTTDVATAAIRLLMRDDASDQDAILEELSELEASAKSNSVVYIFRLGGLAAFVAFILCWRLSRELRHR